MTTGTLKQSVAASGTVDATDTEDLSFPARVRRRGRHRLRRWCAAALTQAGTTTSMRPVRTS